MQWLWFFLPDEALVLVIVLIGLGLMVGLLRGRAAGRLLGGIVLLLLLTPFIEMIVAELPWWIILLLLVAIGWAMLRAFVGFVLGAGAADEMIGTLAADVVRAAFRWGFFLLTLPFRFLGWMLRRV